MPENLGFQRRKNISGDLADTLRHMILDGKLAPGEWLREIELAQRLSVSRTPLREALTTLVAEGALVRLPRRGVMVKQLSEIEAAEIYPIRSLLDPEALRLSGIPSSTRLAELEKLQDKLLNARQAESAVKFDDQWHLLLYADCPNSELLCLIRSYMQKTRRYELAVLRETRVLASSSASKAEIVDYLRRGQLTRACSRLRKSLEDGVKPVLEWLAQRNEGDGVK